MAYRAEQLDLVSDKDAVKPVLPESIDPTIEVWAPELKRKISYWHVGTSSVSRVKLSALSPLTKICTKEATTIIGTSSELWKPVATIGTTYIHLFDDIRIKVHVTESTNVAPFVVDGIIGDDLMKTEHGHWQLNKQDRTFTMGRLKTPIPALPGRELINDYMSILIDRISKASIVQHRWTIASKKLIELRSYLPPQVCRDNRFLIIEILEDYADCFYIPGEKLGVYKFFKYPIKSRGNNVINIPQMNFSQKTWDDIEILISDLLKQEIIRPSKSPYNFPLSLQKKKPDSRGKINYRITVDYSALNKRSESEFYPIPKINDAVDELHGDRYFSVLDLASVSYQIPLEPDHCRETAFTTRSGHYEFQRMPAGIKNAPQYKQRLMNEVLRDMRGKVFVHRDDILIHASDIEEHKARLRQVFSRIRDAGLKLQPDKCQLFQNSVTYLGHVITDEGLLPDPMKIENLRTFKVPIYVDELRSFLGLLSTVKRFLPDHAARTKLLWDRVNKADKDKRLMTIHLDEQAIQRFNELQSSLSANLLLPYPNWKRPFIVEMSSSENGIQATLKQKKSNHGKAHSIAYLSRIYKFAEAGYTASEQDVLAYIWGKHEFRRYLQDKSLTICTEK